MPSDEIPRRCYIDKMTPAELAIRNAVQVAEEAGCDVRLTDAVNLLQQARERVADFVDGVSPKPEPQADAELRIVIGQAEANNNRWQSRSEEYWLQRLMQEVGELASSLAGDHADSPEHELRQIASISLNWLRKRAAMRGEVR